ncbi:probable L-type lectin-domain containing receptor kinase s.7 [Phtheirospermum japonicum]|uniref:non-specific serine/threonine protein kinase n=1 Tax=Phtheirospermum japonicum TaxID=374723 RepID=A0A830CA28_9LAMI|nr:probable L-type lectin-domain containing receptor kinase s.7 [Phtheirospermum japonicum]
MKNPRKLLVFFIIFPIICNPSSSQNVNLEFPSFSLRNLTLLGDSYLRDGVVGLTRELNVPSSSSGSAIYNDPISFFDPESNTTASFSTRFSFSIDNINPASFGDGLTFFLSPNNRTLGSPGGYLGLVNSSQLTKNRFIAVEFDTRLDLRFADPDENHVGLDIDSLTSIKTANLISRAINLKSGNVITAWIDYSNDKKKFQVFLSYSSFKPDDPILAVDIDLSDYLKDFMFVGFSASTEGTTERHYIQNWDFQTNGVSDSSVPLNPPPIPVSDDSGNLRHRKIRLGLGIGCPSFFLIVLVVFGYLSLKKLKGPKNDKILKAELMTGPRQFNYKELKIATKGFHQSRILGHGAFGTVYKAFFVDLGTIAAVKRSKHSHEGKNEFLSELSIIAGLRHKNLVQLMGWCAEKGELLLVYEFMPNGSLDNVLYREGQNGNSLKWCYRYNIALGLASALTYLHQECEQQVIHRDVKTSNILLDGSYNARLGDFGLARLMDHDKSPVSTLTAGTMGYLAPEYLQCGKATEKTDVFSYGVVILELCCGRRPIEREGEGQKMVNLVDWVWKLYSEGKVVCAADERLEGEFDESGMKKLLLVGLSCANPDYAERPTMRRVLQILNREAEPVVVPKKKPSLTFSNSLPLSIDEIVEGCGSDDDDDDDSQLEIRVY